MATIKPPSGMPPAGSVTTPTAEAAPKTSAPSAPPSNVVNPELLQKALKDYQKLQKELKKPLLSGAASLFTDNVVFPADLLDPSNPLNDPKYLHLLCATFGLKDLEQFFETREQQEEDGSSSEEQSSDEDSEDSQE